MWPPKSGGQNLLLLLQPNIIVDGVRDLGSITGERFLLVSKVGNVLPRWWAVIGAPKYHKTLSTQYSKYYIKLHCTRYQHVYESMHTVLLQIKN